MFSGGHPKIFKQDLCKLDIKCWEFLPVGGSSGFNKPAPSHDTLHDWNAPNKLASKRGLGKTVVISQLFCQPSRQKLVGTWPGVDCKMKDKNWKTNNHMGFANTHLLLMEMFRIGSPTTTHTDIRLTHLDSFVEFSTPK